MGLGVNLHLEGDEVYRPIYNLYNFVSSTINHTEYSSIYLQTCDKPNYQIISVFFTPENILSLAKKTNYYHFFHMKTSLKELVTFHILCAGNFPIKMSHSDICIFSKNLIKNANRIRMKPNKDHYGTFWDTLYFECVSLLQLTSSSILLATSSLLMSLVTVIFIAFSSSSEAASQILPTACKNKLII